MLYFSCLWSFHFFTGEYFADRSVRWARFTNRSDGPSEQRAEPAAGAGLTGNGVKKEALRCLHCECLKKDDCKLRRLAERYGAKGNHYREQDREPILRDTDHDLIVYEPGKCIQCGICVQIASEAEEETGLSFTGRGFHVRVDAPLNRSMGEALRKCAKQCAGSCPTGAIALKNKNVESHKTS